MNENNRTIIATTNENGGLMIQMVEEPIAESLINDGKAIRIDMNEETYIDLNMILTDYMPNRNDDGREKIYSDISRGNYTVGETIDGSYPIYLEK